MGRSLLILFTKLAVNTLALVVVGAIFPRIHFDSTQIMFAAAIVLALVNTYLRPLVIVLTLPFNLLSLGLLTLFINALMLKLVSWLIPGFHVDGFWTAVGGALVISLVSCLLNWFLNPPNVRVHIHRG